MDDLLALGRLAPVTLAEVVAAAPATTRVDRKYLVPRSVAEAFVRQAPHSLQVLVIDGRATTTYRSTYFDTADLATCRAHVQGRRRRWKARSRLYVEDQLCRFEFKMRDGSGLTRKSFHHAPATDYGVLTGGADDFFREQLLGHGLGEVGRLEPAVEVGYARMTLADLETGARVTLDAGVRCTRGVQTVIVDPDRLVVETKGGRIPGASDRLLTRLGARPVPFSKYAASASLMDPQIADNDVRRLVGRELLLIGADESTTFPPLPSPPVNTLIDTPTAPLNDLLRRTA